MSGVCIQARGSGVGTHVRATQGRGRGVAPAAEATPGGGRTEESYDGSRGN